jgi:tetratricopeptide (TPR) repeat protein
MWVEKATRASVPRYEVRNDRALRSMIAALDRQPVTARAAGYSEGRIPQTAGTFLDRGILFAMRGDYDMAIEDFTEAIRLNPDMAGAYMLRGRALFASVSRVTSVGENFSGVGTMSTGGRVSAEQVRIYDLAIEDLTQAIRLDPNSSVAYVERGRAYSDKGDYDRAIADYNQALRINPDLAVAYNNRGNAYYNKGDYDRAIADYTQALRINPNYSNAYISRGNAYYNKRDYDRAIADYNQALRVDPNSANAYIGRGNAYYVKRDYDRAIADYEAALRIDPNYALARQNLENARQARGQ